MIANSLSIFRLAVLLGVLGHSSEENIVNRFSNLGKFRPERGLDNIFPAGTIFVSHCDFSQIGSTRGLS